MKKIFFPVVLLGAALSLSAQEVTVVKTDNTATTVVAVPPSHIRTAFETSYPGVTVVSWVPMNSWWRASYTMDNRVTYVYYNEAAVDYRVALPVLQNSIPEDVVRTTLNLYGGSVYGITKIKSADNMDVYQVRLMENGATTVSYIDAAGVAVTNVFKSTDVGVSMNQ